MIGIDCCATALKRHAACLQSMRGDFALRFTTGRLWIPPETADRLSYSVSGERAGGADDGQIQERTDPRGCKPNSIVAKALVSAATDVGFAGVLQSAPDTRLTLPNAVG